MNDALTVKQLKDSLEGLDENLLVVMEGCDCWGWAGTAKIEERQDFHPDSSEPIDVVEIGRVEGPFYL